MTWISVGISELETDAVEDLWEQPVSFTDFDDRKTWIIHGKKGSGKSTIIDYWSTKDTKHRMVVVKPAEEPAFYEVFAALIQANADIDAHTQVLLAERFIDVVVTTALMRQWYRLRPSTLATGTAATVYDFLTRTGALEGSVLRKAIRFLEAGTKASPIATHFRDYLENDGEPSFQRAREAFHEALRSEGTASKMVACIDDIDDINFTFGVPDRILVDALMGYVFTANSGYVTHHIPIRTILTIPSELYEHRRIWGADKLRSHSIHLRWSDLEAIRALVNKRIAIRRGVRRRHPRSVTDRYSISSAETWAKYFPETIVNRRDASENAFEYCLRHTFYTPREVLELVDAVYEDPERSQLGPLDDPAAIPKWSELFRRKVAQRAQESTKQFITMFSEVYDGVEGVLQAFRDRPAIWTRRSLEAFLQSSNVALAHRDTPRHGSLPLTSTLYEMGFLGLGTHDMRYEPPLSKRRYYDVRFSFLSSSPQDARWEIAIIPPVFYDELGIRSRWGMIVRPHEHQWIPDHVPDILATYNPATNSFAE